MGLDQLRKSLEMKERICPNGIDARNTSHLKHGKKPLMERHRRQKINNYLEELKCLVLSALNKEVSHYNKMEKADILDMVVKYIKAVRTTPSETPTIQYRQQREYSTSVVPRYQAASPSPLGAHSVNVNYNNLYRSSRGTPNSETKENCTRRLESERIDGQNYYAEDTRTRNNVRKYSQESESRMREIPLTKSLSCQTENLASTTQTSISTKIWRPW